MQLIEKILEGMGLSADHFKKDSIVILGSCRLEGLIDESYIHEIHHTHNTKEAIQYLEYITGKIDIPSELHPYVFRSCFLDKNKCIDRDILLEELESADLVCIEICSRKKYIKNGFYIHHLSADKGDSPENVFVEEKKTNDEFILELQGRDEIEEDILFLLDLLQDKKVLFVTHIDSGISKRKALIDDVVAICRRHGIPCANPSDIYGALKNEMIDANHFTKKGQKMLARFIRKKMASF